MYITELVFLTWYVELKSPTDFLQSKIETSMMDSRDTAGLSQNVSRYWFKTTRTQSQVISETSVGIFELKEVSLDW